MFGGSSDIFGKAKLADTTVLQFSEWCGVCRMCADEGGEEGSVGKGRLGGGSRDGRHEEEWEGREQVM